MKFSTRGRYALRMMIELSRQNPRNYVPLGLLAERINVNVKYLEHITHNLVRDGMLQVMRGSAGGYRLCRKPEDYTVYEILWSAEGSLVPVSCMETDINLCDYSDMCPTLLFWQDFYERMSEFLKETTLADFSGGKYDPEGENIQ